MPREITDRGRVVEAVQNLSLTAELFEEQNGKQKYGTDLEVIVQGRDYGNGKRVGPYVRLLAYDGGQEIMRQGEWGGNTFYIAVEGSLDVYVREAGGQKRIGGLEPGACFGEMALLAGVERNATVKVPDGQSGDPSEPRSLHRRRVGRRGGVLVHHDGALVSGAAGGDGRRYAEGEQARVRHVHARADRLLARRLVLVPAALAGDLPHRSRAVRLTL